MADIRAVKRYAKLFQDKKAAEAKVKAIKAAMADLEPGVLEYFQNQGMSSWSGGGSTVYLRRELWAGKAPDCDMSAFEEAIVDTEYEPAIKPTFSTQTMSTIMREREEQLRAAGTRPNDIQHVVPDELRPFVRLSEVFKIGVRKK